MLIQVLLITKQVDFSVKIKQALEKLGEFEINPFASVENALAFLQANPLHVAIVDIGPNELFGVTLINRIRSIQPDIRFIIGPDTPEVARAVSGLDGMRIVDLPIGARELAPLIRQSVNETIVDVLQETTPIESSDVSEPFLSDETPFAGISRDSLAPQNKDDILAVDDDEGALQQGDTVGDLIRQIRHNDPPEDPDLYLEEPESSMDQNKIENGDSSANTAALILESALDPSIDLEDFSLERFLERINQELSQDQPRIRPLPSWVEEARADSAIQAQFSLEDENTDFLDFIESLEYLDQVPTAQPPTYTTIDLADCPEAQFVIPPGSERSSQIPIDNLPQIAAGEQSDDPPSTVSHEFSVSAEQGVEEPVSDLSAPDSDVTQLALTLTKVSLALSTEAVLLMHGDKIVSYAGELPKSDIEHIRQTIADGWESETQKVRIRFISLPGYEADFMLYSQRTGNDLTMSMVLAGNTPLSVIQQQADRLVSALQAIPEIDLGSVNPEIEELSISDISLDDPEEGVYTEPDKLRTVEHTQRKPYTFIWLLRSGEQLLSLELIRYLKMIITARLLENNWVVHALDVYQDYVYLFVDVPEQYTLNESLQFVMEMSASVIRDQQPLMPGNLWSDSYFILSPGREMRQEEIEEFIRFARE